MSSKLHKIRDHVYVVTSDEEIKVDDYGLTGETIVFKRLPDTAVAEEWRNPDLNLMHGEALQGKIWYSFDRAKCRKITQATYQITENISAPHQIRPAAVLEVENLVGQLDVKTIALLAAHKKYEDFESDEGNVYQRGFIEGFNHANKMYNVSNKKEWDIEVTHSSFKLI